MKIHIENFQRLRQIDLSLDDAPITLVAGLNEAGKTSLVDALRLALLHESGRVPRKKDWPMLVNDLAQKGAIEITGDGWSTRVTLPAGTTKTTGKPPRGPALLSSLSPSMIGGLRAADDRRAFFCDVLGIRADRASIQARLIERDCDPAPVSQMVGDSWADMADFATTRASEARGAWRAITGEVYGPEKAETWVPTVPPQPADAQTPTALRIEIEAEEARLSELAKRVGALEAQQVRHRGYAKQMDEAAALAATFSRHATALTQAEKELTEAHASLAQWRERLAPATPTHWPCPDCGAVLRLEGDVLVAHDPAPIAAHPEAAAKVRQFEAATQMLERSVANRRRDLAAAETAAKTLEALRAAGAGDPVEDGAIEAVREQMSLVQDRLRSLRTSKAQGEAADAAREGAARVRDAAADAHKTCKEWVRIAELCGPAGLPAADLAGALSAINDRLAHTSRLSGWRTVLVREDMEILVGGRLHALCSESARWRADALLAEAAAHLSGLHFLVLDRVDVLDAPGRIQLFRLLHSLVKEGAPLTALLAGTFKEPPAGLPSTFRVHWLAEGELVSQTQQEAA